MMRSASRKAADSLHSRENSLFDGRISSADLTTLAGELYAVGQLLGREPRLRRTLGDPATAPAARSALAERLFGAKIGDRSMDLVKDAVGQRWSTPWDLSDALESAGDDALFAAAEKDGRLDDVEDELFRLERILNSQGEVTSLLDEAATEPARRTQLLESLVADKVSPVTLALLRHAVSSSRKRTIMLAIDDLIERAAARKERSVARVFSAVPLTPAQEDRLAASLAQIYGRPVSVRTSVEPSVRGGLVVRVGDEVIDGSIAARFAQARAALAG